MRLFGPSTFIFLAMCGFGYYKYDEYTKRPPPTPPPVARPAQKLKEIPLSANPLNALKSAKDTIQKAGDAHKSAYNTVADMDPTTATGKVSATGSAVAWPESPSARTVQVVKEAPLVLPTSITTGKVVVTDSKPAAPPENIIATSTNANQPKPNAAFARWAERLQIRGMRLGGAPRVFIGSMAYEIGSLVEPQLGITFDSYNQDTRFLRFKDRTGAVIEIRH